MQQKNERWILSFELEKGEALKLAFIAKINNTTISELLRLIVHEYVNRPQFNTKHFIKQFLKEIGEAK